MRETEILAEQQTPQGSFVYDHAGRVLYQFAHIIQPCWASGTGAEVGGEEGGEGSGAQVSRFFLATGVPRP